jgi:hypothetical protein
MQRCLGAALLLFLALAQSAWADWKVGRESLDRRLASADFSIYYTLDGAHAFAPDQPVVTRATVAVERSAALLRQLQEADRIFRDELGLRPPFAGARHADGRGIHVHLLALIDKKGSTGDELHRFDYRHFPASEPVLTIAIDHAWQPPGLTPAHELFHAYQYGYTFFKNPWFLEGMARASEHFFKAAPPRQVTLPASSTELDALLQSSYRAESLWNRLVALCGRSFFKDLLENYERIDRLVARERGIDPTLWPEKQQRSTENNPYLLRGLAETVETHCPQRQHDELRAFRQAIQQRLTP